MKATGIVRKVDELGRIVLPMELRKNLGLNIKDSLEIFVEGDDIILRKYQQSCIFCGEENNLAKYKGKAICSKCKDGFLKIK